MVYSELMNRKYFTECDIYFDSMDKINTKASNGDWDSHTDEIRAKFWVAAGTSNRYYYGVFEYWYNGHNADGITVKLLKELTDKQYS